MTKKMKKTAPKKRMTYTQKTKTDAVWDLASGKTFAETAKKYKCSVSALINWKKAANKPVTLNRDHVKHFNTHIAALDCTAACPQTTDSDEALLTAIVAAYRGKDFTRARKLLAMADK